MKAIARFLKDELHLTLHPKKIYLQHYAKGVKFIGAVIKKKRIYIANRTKGNCWETIRRQNEIVKAHRPNQDEILHFQSSVNSYLGFMCHYRTHKIRRKIFRKDISAYWWNYVYVRKGYLSLKMKPTRQPLRTFHLRGGFYR